jgi:CheY-like chemotaxis protein
MRCLLVEDDADFASDVEAALRAIPGCEVVWARSRNSADIQLAGNSFELVILDRNLPSIDDKLDDHRDHGWAVFNRVREGQPGTPVWFLTGTADPDFAAELNNDHSKSRDLNGRKRDEQMYRVFWKRNMDVCIGKIQEFCAARRDLEAIAVANPAPRDLDLSADEARVIKIFARRHDGASVSVSSLNGGLTNSRVLKVVARANDGRALLVAAAKVAAMRTTYDEAEKYRDDIVKLVPGGFPQLTEVVDAGGANTGGIFYGMVGVGEDVTSLFRRIAQADAAIVDVPSDILRIEQPWYDATQKARVRVGEIRRRLIGDAALHRVRDQLEGIAYEAAEAREIDVARCCQHGDLHCANIVFGNDGRAMLIDFGDCGPSFASVDPVTLELSTIFHSQVATLPKGWPDSDTMAQWVDLDTYVVKCRYEPFIRACRAWANRVAGSREEVIAAAYAYGMRQLKYKDTNKDHARSLVRGCILALEK